MKNSINNVNKIFKSVDVFFENDNSATYPDWLNKQGKKLYDVINKFNEATESELVLQEDRGHYVIVDQWESMDGFDPMSEQLQTQLRKTFKDPDLYLEPEIIGRLHVVSDKLADPLEEQAEGRYTLSYISEHGDTITTDTFETEEQAIKMFKDLVSTYKDMGTENAYSLELTFGPDDQFIASAEDPDWEINSQIDRLKEQELEEDIHDTAFEAAKYMYEDYKERQDINDIDDYETFTDNIMVISEQEYNTAINIIKNLPKFSLYGDLIELSDNRTLHDIDFPEEGKVDSDEIGQVISTHLDKAIEDFERDAQVELFTEGRSGRHICVHNTFENALNYEKLKQIQQKCEKDFIENVSRDLKDVTDSDDDNFDSNESERLTEELSDETTQKLTNLKTRLTDLVHTAEYEIEDEILTINQMVKDLYDTDKINIDELPGLQQFNIDILDRVKDIDYYLNNSDDEEIEESDNVEDLDDDSLRDEAKKHIRTGKLGVYRLRKNIPNIDDIITELSNKGVLLPEDYMETNKGLRLRGSGIAKIVDSLDPVELRGLCLDLGITPTER